MLSVPAYREWNSCESYGSESRYLNVKQLNDIRVNRGNVFSRFFDRFIQLFVPSKQREARILMRNLITRIESTETFSFEETLKIFRELKSCANEKDKKRFGIGLKDNCLVLMINLQQINKEAQSDKVLLPSENDKDASNEILETTKEMFDNWSASDSEFSDSFSYSEQLSMDYWENVKSSYSDLLIESARTSSLTSQPATDGSTSNEVSSAEDNAASHQVVRVQAEPVGNPIEGALSLLDDPLDEGVKTLLDSLCSNENGNDSEQDSFDILKGKLATLKELTDRIKSEEKERIKIKYEKERFVLSVNCYKDLKRFKDMSRLAASGYSDLRQARFMQSTSRAVSDQTYTWSSEEVPRAKVMQLIEDKIVESDKIKGWQETDELFRLTIQNQVSFLSLAEDYSGDLAEVSVKATADDVKQKKINFCIKAISTAETGLPAAINILKAEYGWDEYTGSELTEKIIQKLKELDVRFYFKKIPETDHETANAIEDHYEVAFVKYCRKVFIEDITEAVIEGAYSQLQKRLEHY